MTEAEWLASNEPKPMLAFVSSRVSDRKLRLFAAACCRDVWHLIKGASARQAVAVGEEFADGLVSAEVSRQAAVAAWQWFWHADQESVNIKNAAASAARSAVPTGPEGYSLMGRTDSMYENLEIVLTNLHFGKRPRQQARLFRDIVGNPFHAPLIASAVLHWHDGTVPRLAQGIYESRNFEGLPILADALEDAGCDSAAILEHCRAPGPHVLGCWVVDLLMGRE